MNLVYPRLPWSCLPRLLGYSALGGLIAGLYGILHDQITYTISPEYFTKLKFHQFAWADLGFPPRVYVAEVGFLATWWVGSIAGWFLARAALKHRPAESLASCCLQGFAVIFVCAALGGWGGLALDLWRGPNANLSGWRYFSDVLGVADLRHFVRVGFIHSGGYLGALLGLIIAWWSILSPRAGTASSSRPISLIPPE